MLPAAACHPTTSGAHQRRFDNLEIYTEHLEPYTLMRLYIQPNS